MKIWKSDGMSFMLGMWEMIILGRGILGSGKVGDLFCILEE